jgi:hypothetical protein
METSVPVVAAGAATIACNARPLSRPDAKAGPLPYTY